MPLCLGPNKQTKSKTKQKTQHIAFGAEVTGNGPPWLLFASHEPTTHRSRTYGWKKTSQGQGWAENSEQTHFFQCLLCQALCYMCEMEQESGPLAHGPTLACCLICTQSLLEIEPHSFAYLLPMAVFAVQWHNRTATTGPQNLKFFFIKTSTEKELWIPETEQCLAAESETQPATVQSEKTDNGNATTTQKWAPRGKVTQHRLPL